MKASGLGILMVVLLILIVSLALYIKFVVLKGELGEKRAAVLLQGIEFKSREKLDAQEPVLLYNAEGSGYNVLGLPTKDAKFPHVWIILNEAAPMSSVYKMPGDVPYYVRCSFVSDLSSKTQIVPQVLDALKKACVS